MKKQQSSITAEGIALVRALESNKPAGERVCYDPWARFFVNPLLYRMGSLFMNYGRWRSPGVYEFLVSRCRYIDDYVTAARRDGAEQVVILGAGFDSRAYRLDALKDCPVLEVDYPATQHVKRRRLTSVFGKLPDHVTFVPVDFEGQTLDCLLSGGCDVRLKTVFVWEGVTYYLGAAAVENTLAFVARNSMPTSSIIFDYVYAGAITGKLKRNELVSMRRYRRFTGEGIQFGIEKGKIGEFLAERGFSQVENVDAKFFRNRYWTRGGTSVPVAPIYAIAHAAVGPAGD